ncbi:tyrosinase family protein [Bradyrhizobium sp. CCGB20]|uniref:tyrosinase family protein n=1 Tax=Bradyrhizobium sp. CCGB20 TaxID=2949633 RepID=UPI0020B38535|nr:tyrosinase family protein [Bradyrhizobium sp. CCGB20]MCP3396488.1 tyrosinase family protein [Bradyrhizobium sp. CCGB20]
MAEREGNAFAHVVANIDTASSEGRIRYVLPSRMRTGSAQQAAPSAAGRDLNMGPDVRLILKDVNGQTISEVRPELRFEACHDEGETPHRAIIQQDIAVTDALSQIELVYQGKMLDAFKPSSAATVLDRQLRGTMTLGLPQPGRLNRFTVGAPHVEQRAGVSYLIQAKPDNADQWQTLAVGRPTPDFEVDQNQFPGASSVDIRVTQNAGFQSQTLAEKRINLAGAHSPAAASARASTASAPQLGGRGEGMLVRQNIWELGGDWADPILWYARAVGALRAKPLNDRTSWRFWAGMHGYHQGLWQFYGYQALDEQLPAKADFDQFWLQCQHGSWYFLPWHRGYLIGFEKLIRATVVQLGGPADWTLPYWNYFKAGQNGLPPAFGSKDWPDGTGNNPLFIEQRWGPDPSQPGNVFVPLEAVNLDAMDVHEFTGVASGGDRGFGGIDTGFEHGGAMHGDIEGQPHDQVHGLVGGEMLFPEAGTRPLPGLMSSPVTAGLDPIFWLHHANIDRLWQSWRQSDGRNTDPEETSWKKGPASLGQHAFVVPLPDGSPWEFTPEQMSDFAGLGYTYSDFSPAGTPLAPVAGMRATPSGAVAMPKSTGAAIEVVGASAHALPVAGKGAETSVQLDTHMHAKVAGRLAAGPAPGARAEQVFLNLENVRGYSDATVLQVYMQFAGKDGAPTIERQVGSIGLFGVTKATETDAGHTGDGLSYVLNITKPYQEFAGSVNVDPAKVGVRLQAVAPVQQSADVSVGRISIVRQGD